MAKVGRLIYVARQSAMPMAVADAIGMADWLERADRGEWFTACDPQLQALQVLAITHGASTRQVLGVSPGRRAMTTLRKLLALAGYRLEAKRNLEEGDRAWLYRVVAEPLFRTGPTCPIKGIQLTFTRCNLSLTTSNKHRPNSKTYVKIYQEYSE